MPFNPLSGVTGHVKIATNSYAFTKFTIAMKIKIGDVSNFTGQGYEQYVVGLTGAKIDVEGPYDQGQMIFALGNSYSLELGFTAAVTVVVPCTLETIDFDVDVTAPADKLKLGFQSNGLFTAGVG